MQQQQPYYPPQQPYQPQPGYPQQPQPGYPQQPQVVIVQQVVMQPQFAWASGEFDCCAGGAGLCLYVHFCGPCAAGDVAVAAGRDYMCACCVAPLLGHLAHHRGCQQLVEGCFWMADRRALAQRYGINDALDRPCQLPNAFCMMTCMPHCLLIQELHHIRSVAEGKVPGPPGLGKAMVPVQQTMM